MTLRSLRYEPYEETLAVPNVVVDGSPNASTVLTLTHWPGIGGRPELAADLSAQMAFRYITESEPLHGSAEVVTNNHFDQDGLVSVYALSRPEDALARRPLLEGLAAAGDFAIYRDRRAARLSMALATFADPERSPLRPFPEDYPTTCALFYREVLGRLPDLVDRLDQHRVLWEDEDEQLDASEQALAAGHIVIEEHPAVDLAVVTIDESVGGWSGHRFASRRFDGVHPMALHNATDRFAMLLVHGRRYRFIYRYETWVQYRSRRPRPRVDLVSLADRLTAAEAGATVWHADPIDDLTPQLTTGGDESSLASTDVVSVLSQHLAAAPAAWDPYPAGVAAIF